MRLKSHQKLKVNARLLAIMEDVVHNVSTRATLNSGILSRGLHGPIIPRPSPVQQGPKP